MEKIAKFLAATTLVSAVAATYFWHQLRSERQSVAMTRAGGEMAGLQGIAPPLLVSPRLPDVLASRVSEADASQAAAVTVVASEVTMQSLLQRANQSPKETLLLTFPGLLNEAGFSLGEIDVLAGLMAEHAFPAEMEAVLGAEKYQSFVRYSAAVSANDAVKIIRSQLSSKDALSEIQSRSLIATLTDSRLQFDGDARAKTPATNDPLRRVELRLQLVDMAEASNRRVTDAAASYLSEGQLAELRKFVALGMSGARGALEAQRTRLARGAN